MVLTPLLIGNAVMLTLSLLGFHLLSATRAYVGGESQWSKARAQAVRHLRSYAGSGDPRDLQRFETALQVPMGDQAARIAMDQPRLDRELTTAALLRGGNAAGDIPGMIRLYRWFSASPLLAEPIEVWRRADMLIEKLRQLAEQLRPRADQAEHAARVAMLLAAVNELDNELLGLELQFSQSLGEASRQAFLVLAAIVGLTALLLTLTAYQLARLGLRRQTRYEIALEDANRRWSLAAESDGLGLFEWWHADDRVLLDARACAAYGLDSGPDGLTLQRARLREQVEMEDRAALQVQLEQALSSGATFHQRYRIRRAGDAAPRHLEVTGLMRGSLAAGDRRMVGVVKDVSAEVRQAQLALDKAAAERSAAARMEFLSRLSHELRTPLNAVLGFSDLLLLNSAEPLAARQRRNIEMIQGAGKHLLRLVDDVLDISSIDSGQFSVLREPTPLAPVLQEALDLSAAEAQEFDVRLLAEPLPPDLAVLGDAHRLSQVLANLISNACKYNRRGGEARVRTRLEAQRLLIEVEDQGEGLSEMEMAALFQPFKRLPATAHLRGTGLGLSIVKLLVEQMGGAVEVRSTPGRGTVFGVRLQRAEA
ncbi:MAG TPA: HAMP domain-containing sensor histidine kinase [Roseateles sp.]|nr:HAMP domain-containing sensor histidine kinase [Roseateles sp.]